VQDGDPPIKPPEEGEKTPSEAPRASRPPRASQPGRLSPAPRASQPPRPSLAPHPWRGTARVLFALAWLGAQAALVLTADRRTDAAFGFRMFSDSSTLKTALFREIVGADGARTRVHVEDGVWSANDAGGLRRRFAWTDRVRRSDLARFDKEIVAAVGADAQVSRLRAALEDVATHTPDDAETRRFLLEVTVRRNGREAYVVHLASAERAERP
jgi:hypothetical protein